VLWGLVVLAAPTLFTSLAREDTPRFPEPPRQKDAWKPPATKVPDDFVKAAALLFEQGLADPRGCEYRAVELATGERTHAWVLPAKDRDKQRFAVCWNGLVCPVVSVGDKADLKKDIRASVKKDDEGPVRLARDGELFPRYRGDLSTALLLRLGEGDLASELWAANHPPPAAGDGRPAPKVSDPYLSLARESAWAMFDRAVDAHKSGDDAAALHGFRKLTAFAGAVEGAAKKHGFEPSKERENYLYFLWQLPDLLADQERRAKEGEREAVVCVGPDRDPDQQKRIAALVLRLDEVVGRSFFPDVVDFRRDPVVKALIREGSPAVEPLLKCFEDDRRLTRSIRNQGKWEPYYTCGSVHEAAYVALAAILDFSPREKHDEDRKKLAARFREHIEKTKGLTPAERWFQVLADDKAKPDEWHHAATMLLSPDPAAVPRTTPWPNLSESPPPRREEKPKLLGESLRGKRAPSVTELVRKRIEQSEAWNAADPALMLAEWEPKAALETLAELTKRLRQQDEDYRFLQVIQKRHELGDRKALDDYVAFIRAAHPKMLFDGHSNLFGPMADHPDHPGMAKAAEELFADEKSPWLPLLQERVADEKRKNSPVYVLIPTPLLRLPAFRNAVLKELANKTKIGTATLSKDGRLAVESRVRSFSWSGRDRVPPKEEIRQEFRACDCCANLLSGLPCAPRCELYWTEAERDKAVAACAEFLRGQRYELSFRSKSLGLDRPATAAQVEQGRAVFSLAGEGEVRVVSGLKLPAKARWVTLKDRPYRTGRGAEETVEYEQDGEVVQAEEVLKDRRWRRYYGFVGVNHAARVPAEEIEFPVDDEWDWVRVGPDLHARLEVPSVEVEAFDDHPFFLRFEDHAPRLPADTTLEFGVAVHNARGVERPAPDAAASVRLKLLYSPAVVSRQGALAPQAQREAEWQELARKPGAKFKGEKGKALAAGEERRLASLDLREWYDVSRPGFYRLQLLPAGPEKDADKDRSHEVRFSLAPPEKPKPDPKP
jgi:hypothetical protein